MELIRYQKTLDVHKNGTQFLLQGFETADNMSRVIEISLMASGDAVDFPLERIVAMMYVTTPGATEPSINECTIKDNKIIYNVLPITAEGITEMQLKLIDTDITGAKRVLASPKFAVEVTNSNTNDDGKELTTTFTAIEDFVAKAEAAYGSRLERIELDSECIFKAYYYDGSTYETDILQKLFLNGNVELSKSYAMGGTGVRTGEDTDNSKYYSNVSKSEALNAKAIMEDSEEILEEVRLHGKYTAFKVDFTTGEVEYVSPSFKFKINEDTGELDAEGQRYSFAEEIYGVVNDWLMDNNVVLTDLRAMVGTIDENTQKIDVLQEDSEMLKKRVTPIELGGTGATTAEEARDNLGVTEFVENYQRPWNVDSNVGNISHDWNSFDLLCVTTDVFSEADSPPIYMKNSGQLYLCFDLNYDSSNIIEVEAVVYVNDTLIKTYTNSDVNALSGNIKTLLTVKKGDIVILKLRGKSRTTIHYKVKMQNIRLQANVETPYTYLDIFEGADEITATDILNALTGGVD